MLKTVDSFLEQTQKAVLDCLNQYRSFSKTDYLNAAYQSNIGILSHQEQERLHNATIAIPGMGGVGGSHLISLARTGIGAFRIADFDDFEPKNINRQYGARADTFGKPKIDILTRDVLQINPWVKLERFPQGVNHENMADFVSGCNLIVDSIDYFEIDARRRLYQAAYDARIPVIIAAPLGFSACLLVFQPGTSPTFDSYFDINDSMTKEQQLLKFGLAVAPSPTFLKYMDLSKISFGNNQGPSNVIGCYLCSAMAVMEALRLILDKPGLKPVPYYTVFDPYRSIFKKKRLFGSNRNPWQRFKYLIMKRRLLKR